MRLATVARALILITGIVAWATVGQALPDGVGLCMGGDQKEAPGFLSIEPDTDGGCVWWLDVLSPERRSRRFHFPTKVRCEETRAVVVELLDVTTWRVDLCR